MLRVTPELERSHDLVMQVAGRAGLAAPGRNLTPRARDLAARMGDLAGGMWRQAADAWHQRDRGAAAALAGRARELDELHAALAAELAAGQVTTPVAMEMTWSRAAISAWARTQSTSPGGPATSPGPQEGNRCRTTPAGSGAPSNVNGNMASHGPCSGSATGAAARQASCKAQSSRERDCEGSLNPRPPLSISPPSLPRVRGACRFPGTYGGPAADAAAVSRSAHRGCRLMPFVLSS